MEHKILGYLGAETIISKEAAQKLTHINTAFGRVTLEGKLIVSHLNMLEQMHTIREYNPKIKIMVSIVNQEPEAFTLCAADATLREKFADSCAEMIEKYGFDGVDLDWEYPCVPSNGVNATRDDRENFSALCKSIRERLNKIENKKPLFTIAAGADIYYTYCVDLPEVMKYLDYVCLMTYDLKCGFHALAGHHTQLYSSTGDVFQNSCDQALKVFEKAGVPKEKLLMGVAFYSRKWENIENRNNGFLQISKTGGGYGPDYSLLKTDFIDKNGFTRYWDDEAKAPFLFDGSTFLSYDDVLSITHKCEYVKREQIGGIFYWEHKCDSDDNELLNALYDGINK